jgi:hypothetical protein
MINKDSDFKILRQIQSLFNKESEEKLRNLLHFEFINFFYKIFYEYN